MFTYYLYLYGFKFLYALGMKKTSVRLARNLEKYTRSPLDKSKLYDAIWEFTLNVQSFPLCQGNFGCDFPILSENDSFHETCRIWQTQDAAWQAEEAEWAEFASEEEAKLARQHEEDLDIEDPSFYYESEDDEISPAEVYRRAYRHFGNHEMARECTQQYPGDFI